MSTVGTTIYDKTGEKFVIPAIYSELPYFFKLIHGETILQIGEPIGFDQIEMAPSRDNDWHGFNYEGQGSNYTLKFDCQSGMDLIKEVFDQEGNDGEIILQYGVTYKEDGEEHEVIEFEYKLDLNSYRFRGDINIVECLIETKSIFELVRSRWDTKLNFLDNKDLDNNSISPIGTYQLPLFSKAIEQRYENKVTKSIEADLQFIEKTNRNAYVTFDSNNPTIDEISFIPKMEFGVSEGSEGDPITSEKYLLKATNEGRYKFTINHQFLFNTHIVRHVTGTNVSITSWALKVWFVIKRADGSANTAIDLYSSSGTGGTGSDNKQVSKSVSITQTVDGIDLKAGDKVFYYCHYAFTAATPLTSQVNTYVRVTNVLQEIKVDAFTTAKTSFTKALRIGDIIKKGFQMVTGKNVVFSSFYSSASEEQPSDGCGANYVLTNGFQLRNFDSNNKPIRGTLGELMSSLKVLHGIGMAYEFDGENEIIRIAKAEDFYRDVEIITIDECQNYEETTAKELIYNQIEVGYEKFVDDGTGGLNDFHTKHEYQTPIKSYRNKLPLLSKLIASGEIIENVRRDQFEEKPKDSTSYDDNLFIIAIVPFTPTPAICDFIVEEYEDPLSLTPVYTYKIAFAQNYSFLRVGLSIIISNSIGNDGTYIIKEVASLSDGKTYIVVEEPLVNEVLSNVVVSFPDTTIQPESDENITVAFSESDMHYNLRLTPKRILLNNAKFINSGLYYKSASDFIKLTDIKGNGEITTQFKESALCSLGDTEKALITEKNNIFLANFDENSKIFRPEYVIFETTLTREQIRYINNALRGRNTDGTNYGYIRIKDPQGDYQKVFINEMKFNPVKCSVKFSTVKKKE